MLNGFMNVFITQQAAKKWVPVREKGTGAVTLRRVTVPGHFMFWNVCFLACMTQPASSVTFFHIVSDPKHVAIERETGLNPYKATLKWIKVLNIKCKILILLGKNFRKYMGYFLNNFLNKASVKAIMIIICK